MEGGETTTATRVRARGSDSGGAEDRKQPWNSSVQKAWETDCGLTNTGPNVNLTDLLAPGLHRVLTFKNDLEGP